MTFFYVYWLQSEKTWFHKSHQHISTYLVYTQNITNLKQSVIILSTVITHEKNSVIILAFFSPGQTNRAFQDHWGIIAVITRVFKWHSKYIHLVSE